MSHERLTPSLTVGLLPRSLSLRLTISNPILFFLLLTLQIRNAFLHPLRRRRALQEMIEEFLQPARVVLLINAFTQAMLLAVVAEHVRLFIQPPQTEIEFDALVPWHRIVFVVID